MLVLIETPAGYGLFRVCDSKLLQVEDAAEVAASFSSAAAAQQLVKLEAFSQFKDTQQAVEEALRLSESRMGGGLKKFLKRHLLSSTKQLPRDPTNTNSTASTTTSSSKTTTVTTSTTVDASGKRAAAAATTETTLIENGESLLTTDTPLHLQQQLAVSDRALGAAIKSKFGVDVVFSPATHEIIRGIKEHLASLLHGFSEEDRQTMAVSLAHSLNRFKLKFSPEKVDTMIIQAVALLDDLDRELNNFSMRLKEWYGWHFPELSNIVGDNLLYAKAVQLIGFRTNTKHVDLSTLLPDEVSAEVKMAAETSMGTDMTEEDLQHINTLAARVEELMEYRVNLADYLKLRMKAVAPNLTYMVGEVIGARLMAHAGSLLNLSKQPASTIQIVGAEKALFRALKTKSHTPKYGLLYHAALVGQAPPKLKGKISRVLAAKLSLCVRVDALTEAVEAAASAAGNKVKAEAVALPPPPAEATVAISCRRHVEVKLLQLEQQLRGGVARPTMKPQIAKYEPRRLTETARVYDPATDAVENNSFHAQTKGGKRFRTQETARDGRPAGPAADGGDERPKKKKVKKEQTDTSS